MGFFLLFFHSSYCLILCNVHKKLSKQNTLFKPAYNIKLFLQCVYNVPTLCMYINFLAPNIIKKEMCNVYIHNIQIVKEKLAAQIK